MMLSIGSLFRSFRENVRYLLPIGVGGVVGVLLTSNVLSMLVVRYEAQLLSLFTGLVLGSLPELYAEVRLDVPKLRWKHAAATLLGLGFVLAFALGEAVAAGNAEVRELTVPAALLSGAVLSVGTVIPGISSSFILVYLGLYPAVIATIASVLDLKTLTSSGLAAAVGSLGAHILPLLAMAGAFGLVSIFIIKLVNRVLKRHHATAYAAVLGFVVGSVALVLPSIIAKLTWACPAFFAAGLALSYLEYHFKEKITGQKAALPAPAEAADKTDDKTDIA